MRHWRTTGNSNVANKTGSTYISDSMADITTIPTTTWSFQLRRARRVSTSVYNIERQLEIAIWPPKPEVVTIYTTGSTTDSVEIRTASPGFSTMASPNKVSPNDCDNDPQPEMHGNVATKTGNTYISGTMTDRISVPTANMGVFDHAQLEETAKPTTLLVFPVIRLPYWISSTHIDVPRYRKYHY